MKNLMNEGAAEPWDVCTLLPGGTDTQVAELAARFFNNISSEHRPLDPSNIAPTFDREFPYLTENQISNLLRKMKKSKTTVPGDIVPRLYGLYSDALSVSLTDIFNSMTQKQVWPEAWRIEYATIIPKSLSPTELSECRNIAWTNYLSKVYENVLMTWTRQEVTTKPSQFGGERGCGTDHLLTTLWHEIGSALEDHRSAVVLSAIDLSKAFNRLEHEACLKSFRAKGASNQVLSLLSAFFMGRVMTVRVGTSRSAPHAVNAGAPQGSVLGCFLFNIGTDNLEDGCSYLSSGRMGPHQSSEVLIDDFPAT